MQKQTHIQISKARSDVQITLPSNIRLSGKVGTTVETFFREAQAQGIFTFDAQYMGAIVDGKLRELSYEIRRDAIVKPVTLANSDGGRIYRRSLVLLMAAAIDDLWEGTHVNVNYAVRDGGFYCELANREPFTKEELTQLDTRMRELVAQDEPIIKRTVSLDEARTIFKNRGNLDKVRLLDYRTRDTLTIYSLDGHDDYYFGYMVPSTAYLNLFKLIDFENAFVLQYPRKESSDVLKPLHIYDKLHAIFEQADDWLTKLNVEDIGRLNHLVQSNNIQEMILIAEALHEQNVAKIATQIVERHQEGVRIILIAGPSSSGKTTFSKRLAIQLLALGLSPYTVEMDNYFVERARTPLDENGEYDFESIDALDLNSLNDHLLRLMRGEQVQLPKFNFHTGTPELGKIAKINDNQILILEGIHGMNPHLLDRIPSDNIFRIYVSVLSQVNIDSHNRVPTTDVRLLRRIVRDARGRGYSATDTLMRWQSVRRGEKRNIFPYQENADVMFNSGLAYELAALRPLVEPLLRQVEPNTPPYIEANRLLSFLRWVAPLNPQQSAMIPDISLLLEFMGNSILDDYHPGGDNHS
ncbi:MAG: nucleoside kinase [Phototrophicaceae bacterium]